MIYGYKEGSQSVDALAKSLGIKKIKHKGSSYKGGQNKIVINWGASIVPEQVTKSKILNKPSAVRIASNKLMFFNRVNAQLNIPDFTTDKELAKSWLEAGKTVFARANLTGHSGDGIYIMESPLDWDDLEHSAFKMYVKYIPKSDEYRVHVVNGEVIDIRRKSIKKGVNKKNINWKIRSHKNGFIFAKDGFEVDEQVIEQAKKAISLCELDFGAVDIIWNNFYKKAYVLEINTAPGLEGSTVDNYAAAFSKILKDEKTTKCDEPLLKTHYFTLSEVLGQTPAAEKWLDVPPMVYEEDDLEPEEEEEEDNEYGEYDFEEE